MNENIQVFYHQQDTDYYCGAACAQMVLDSVSAGLLDQTQLYNDNHTHSTAEAGWATAPDGLRWTMNNYAPPAPAAPPHFGYYDFVVFALANEDAISRKIVWTIHNYRVAPIALVYGSQHWIVIRGYSASAAPASWEDVSYSIDSFDVNNPWPPTPSSANPALVPPPPHTDGTDGCGSGGSRGIVNENISYASWQSTYMTGVPSGYWKGQFVAVADPSPPPQRTGRPSRSLLKLEPYHGRLMDPQRARERVLPSLKAYGLLEREAYRSLGALQFGDPVLVQRLDLDDTFYYIVPAIEGERTPAAVMLDAKNGAYLQSASHAGGGTLFTLRSREEIAELVIDRFHGLDGQLGKLYVRPEAVCHYPILVWEPCLESLSPLYPFHLFTIGNQQVYVRIDGTIFTALHTQGRGL